MTVVQYCDYIKTMSTTPVQAHSSSVAICDAFNWKKSNGTSELCDTFRQAAD